MEPTNRPPDPSARRWRTAFLVSAAIQALALLMLGGLALAAPRLIHRFVFGPGHVRQVTQFAMLPVAPGDTVFLGDSITEAVHWDELFPAVVARNRGIGGDTVGEVLARLDPILRGRPRRVFVMAGTNDLRTGVPLERSARDFEALLERFQQESPDTEVYVQSVLPRTQAYAPRIRALNERFKQIAKGHGATYLDFFDDFADPRGAIRGEYSNDGLHLLGEGIEVWARLLTPYVLTTPTPPSSRSAE
jgi:lysophospholipase L1-like esterase